MALCVSGQLVAVQAQAPTKLVNTNSKSDVSRGVTPQQYVNEGISVEFSLEPLDTGTALRNGPLSDTDGMVRFKITDTNSGQPITNLRPAAWFDQRTTGQITTAKECREKVQSFLQPGFNKRPSIDLNKYFILALNNEANISVIDPLTGFGGSKLYTLVSLASPGEDWVMSADRKRLYVSMPQVNELAVIDTVTWKVIANIEAGLLPSRLALQPDNRYLWLATGGGVTVIDTVTMKLAASIQTGSGDHEIAFADDGSLVFITNKNEGTLSILDGRKLVRIRDIKVGSNPSSVAFSTLSKAVYVTNESDGTIVVVAPTSQTIIAWMTAAPGLHGIRLLPDSRFGFAINPQTNKVYVFDLTSNRLLHAVPVGPAADQITFTRDFAYVRSTANEFVTMIKIANLEKEASVSRFPAGEKAPRDSNSRSLADAIVPAPEDGAVLIANPADKMIYFYTEGMAAPMGSFQNYKRVPRAVLVLDNGLREHPRGVYTTTVRLGAAGHYDVALLVDSPRLVNCFDVTVVENPALPKAGPVPIKVQPLLEKAAPRVGENFKVRVKVTDSVSGAAKPGLNDLGVLVFLAPGIWQQRQIATSLGEGIYEMSFVPPEAGVYYIYFQSPSLAVSYNQITPFTVRAMP
jgi:YVTN family beta-propeller protein